MGPIVFGGAEVDAQNLAAPSALTPIAINACTLTTRPSLRTLSTSASPATNVYGPASSGRVREVGAVVQLGDTKVQ